MLKVEAPTEWPFETSEWKVGKTAMDTLMESKRLIDMEIEAISVEDLK